MADNGHPGGAVEAAVTLVLDASPVEIPAAILESEREVFLSLGAPATLNCLAYGHPKPTVTWYVRSLLRLMDT